MPALRPLAVMTLGLLREADMHPYEMMRLLRLRGEDRLVAVRNGTFYHQISGLVREGLIADVGVDRDGNRPERTTYTLTPAGDAAVAGWVRAHLTHAARPAEFAVALSEAHNLPALEVIELMSARRDGIAVELADLETRLAAALERAVDRQYLIEIDRTVATLRADLAWTTTFVDDLSAGRLHWGSPSPTHRRMKDSA